MRGGNLCPFHYDSGRQVTGLSLWQALGWGVIPDVGAGQAHCPLSPSLTVAAPTLPPLVVPPDHLRVFALAVPPSEPALPWLPLPHCVSPPVSYYLFREGFPWSPEVGPSVSALYFLFVLFICNILICQFRFTN